MTLHDFFSGWLDVSKAGPLVVLSAIKCTLVLVLGYAASLCTPSTMPARRQLVLRLVLLTIVILPVIAVIMPPWHLTLPGSWTSVWLNDLSITHDQMTVSSDVVVSPETPAAWMSWLLGLFLVGTALVLARIVFGVIVVSNILRSAETNSVAVTQQLFVRLKDGLGIKERVRLLLSPVAVTPFALSLPRPTVVLPSAATSWRQEDLRLALQHELIHIKRRDDLWNMVGTVALVVHWFNPFVWIVRRKLVLEAEKACDDAVLWCGAEAEGYAHFLLCMARNSRNTQTGVLLGAGIIRKKQLEERVMSILTNRIRTLGTTRTLARVSLALTLAVTIPMAVLQLAAAADVTNAVVPKGDSKDSTRQIGLPGPDEFVPVDVMPEMIRYEPPVYPDSAEKAGIEGTAWVKVLVDSTGHVVKSAIHKTSGFKVLDDAALAAAVKNEFKPAEQNGKKIAIWVTYRVEFTLKAKAEEKKK
jgi:TonB family protein